MVKEFQITDIREKNEEDDEDSVGDYVIDLFGRCENREDIYVKVINYRPYFYILIPEELQNKSKCDLEMYVEKLKTYFKSKDCKIKYIYKDSLKELQIIKLKSAEGFTNNEESYFVRLIFNNSDGMKKFRWYIEQNYILFKKLKLYEANFTPMLRFLHIRNMGGSSWVSIQDYKEVFDDDKESLCDIELIVDWRNIHHIMKDFNAPIIIASFDIEVNSIDGEFPQAWRPGDCVIQIGITYTILGTSMPYRQYIACLNNTTEIEGIVVESFDTESDLMLGFLNEINNSGCDILTGYNIFFFDEKYMYDRCKNILKLDGDMAYMSKLKNHKSEFKEMKLASSALGENLLRFWDTPGRIHIDLMKDVQKTYNLSSYKLDLVAANFIRGDIIKYTKLEKSYELQCSTINDILLGDFIHLEKKLGFVSEQIGHKYIVTNINKETKTLTIDYDEEIESNLKLSWSQAKDDVGPKDIFRLFKGSDDDRAIVAKYCVKDCRLVSLLINKLEIITKNIEMANVCCVPLSYLFIRGQGIKIFSLCLKEFRKQKYAFPTFKIDKLYMCSKCKHEYLNKWDCPKCHSKERTEVEMEDTSFEGAIVFDPVAKVDYEACAVKDYMSLYPASIMHKNMCHTTIVENSKYDNLKGITYFNAQYKENDGTIQYRRFAKIGNTLGVIPTILDNLLKERKSIKKLMGKELDPFKYKILDAKQLAVKITANSLYGQLGAKTSPVCKRDIAACTTSTGREMLILAKKYDEETLPLVINSLKRFYNDNDLDKVEKIYDLELKSRNDTKLIEEIKKYSSETIKDFTFQPVVRYGDSVIGQTPLLLRNTITGMIFIDSINNLDLNKDKDKDNYVLMIDKNGKESCEINNIETWTEKGWTKIQRVIRHKLSKDKKLFRITTHSGSVVVTDDHSLLTVDGKEISPKNIKIGDELLHSFPEINTNKEYTLFNGVELNKEIAQFLGMFMGDGSCGYYNCPSGNKASFAINNQNMEIINKYKDIGNKYFSDFNWKVLDTLKSSAVYKLVPSNKEKSYGKLKDFIINFREMMYTNDSQKKVPEYILNANRDIREAFLIGLYEADGQICNDMYDKNLTKPVTNKIRCGSQIDQKGTACIHDYCLSNNKNKVFISVKGTTCIHDYCLSNNKNKVFISVKGMVAAMGIYTLGKSLDYMVSINNRKDKLNLYRIRFCEKIRKTPNAIKKIEEWNEPEEYVYDLTTDNHHFQAGVGSMIVHNTDSIFSCYRFRECTEKVDDVTSLNLWKKIVNFAFTLVEPYFIEEERIIFKNIFDKYYSEIIDLSLPNSPKCMSPSTHNKIILPLEERMKIFIKEYMEESYIPWLWTLSELVEKDYINMFDIKLSQWAEHLLLKYRFEYNDLHENRKKIIMEPIMNYLNPIFDNKYIMPSDDTISDFAHKLNDEFEINIDMKILEKICKNLMENTIKDKWIYSGDKKETQKIIIKYLDKVIIKNNNDKDKDTTIYYLSNFIINNKTLDINKLKELVINNLVLENENITYDLDKMEEITIEFLEDYIKHNGKKTLSEIIEEFCEKDLNLSFNKYKQEHYVKVLNFINENMKIEDMTNMDNKNDYSFYWLQPRWDFIENERKILIDIFKGGQSITDKRTLEYGMELGKLSGELIKSKLPFPHDCEYEKIFWPFAILTKKRYVGNKYDFDPNKYKLDFMGIALKRRDNAAIVKEICSGIIDQLINYRSPQGALQFTRKCIQNMFDGKYDIKYFLQSRTLKLKESYKDWTRIAHVYLADKISKRDPGNTPQSGDRMEYVVIKVPFTGEKLLQGDIIDTPAYVKDNNLEIDYLFYLTNQIMNPALQFLEIVDKNASCLFKEFIDKYSSPNYKKIEKEKLKLEKEENLLLLKQEKDKLKQEKDKLKQAKLKQDKLKQDKDKLKQDKNVKIGHNALSELLKNKNNNLLINEINELIEQINVILNKPKFNIYNDYELLYSEYFILI